MSKVSQTNLYGRSKTNFPLPLPLVCSDIISPPMGEYRRVAFSIGVADGLNMQPESN